jgi:hypothetical protein
MRIHSFTLPGKALFLACSLFALHALAHEPSSNASAQHGGSKAASFAWPKPSADDIKLIRGALDIHVHLDPDSFGPNSNQAARALDVIDMAKLAKKYAMRGFVVKQHYDQSAQLAYVTRKVVPGIEVYGGVGQNLTVGGLNPSAVRHMAEVKGGWGRIVWLPTWDAEHHVLSDVKKRHVAARPYIQISKDGALVPQVLAVMDAVKDSITRDSKGALLLETGHISAEEALLVVKAAKEKGLPHVVVTHAMGNPVFMSVAQMQEAVKLGAMIEFVASYGMGDDPIFTPEVYAQAIRDVGVANVIISSDFGQKDRLLPPDALAVFAGMMKKQGFTAAELHQMLAINPAIALGLAAK